MSVGEYLQARDTKDPELFPASGKQKEYWQRFLRRESGESERLAHLAAEMRGHPDFWARYLLVCAVFGPQSMICGGKDEPSNDEFVGSVVWWMMEVLHYRGQLKMFERFCELAPKEGQARYMRWNAFRKAARIMSHFVHVQRQTKSNREEAEHVIQEQCYEDVDPVLQDIRRLPSVQRAREAQQAELRRIQEVAEMQGENAHNWLWGQITQQVYRMVCEALPEDIREFMNSAKTRLCYSWPAVQVQKIGGQKMLVVKKQTLFAEVPLMDVDRYLRALQGYQPRFVMEDMKYIKKYELRGVKATRRDRLKDAAGYERRCRSVENDIARFEGRKLPPLGALLLNLIPEADEFRVLRAELSEDLIYGEPGGTLLSSHGARIAKEYASRSECPWANWSFANPEVVEPRSMWLRADKEYNQVRQFYAAPGQVLQHVRMTDAAPLPSVRVDTIVGESSTARIVDDSPVEPAALPSVEQLEALPISREEAALGEPVPVLGQPDGPDVIEDHDPDPTDAKEVPVVVSKGASPARPRGVIDVEVSMEGQEEDRLPEGEFDRLNLKDRAAALVQPLREDPTLRAAVLTALVREIEPHDMDVLRATLAERMPEWLQGASLSLERNLINSHPYCRMLVVKPGDGDKREPAKLDMWMLTLKSTTLRPQKLLPLKEE